FPQMGRGDACGPWDRRGITCLSQLAGRGHAAQALACPTPASRGARAALGKNNKPRQPVVVDACVACEAIVVRDASSGSEHELPTDSSLDSNNLAPQLPASHLTQELAQLLAASIARQQASRGSAAPTNAGLTSLANLVSAASAQRT